MSTPNPHHGQDAAVLLSRTYVFAAFGDPGLVPAFLILALSGNLTLGPITRGMRGSRAQCERRVRGLGLGSPVPRYRPWGFTISELPGGTSLRGEVFVTVARIYGNLPMISQSEIV